MRAFRVTHWSNPDDPLSVVVTEGDLKTGVTIEETITPQPGVFITSDVFETEERDSRVALTREAMARMDPEAERNMAILYYWSLLQFRLLVDGGTLACQRPAPLTATQITQVLRQLAIHPAYQNYTIIVPYEHGTVTLRDGEVE